MIDISYSDKKRYDFLNIFWANKYEVLTSKVILYGKTNKSYTYVSIKISSYEIYVYYLM